MRDNEVGMFTTKVGFAASVRSSRQDPTFSPNRLDGSDLQSQ
jgi:hypothetical protein